MNEPIGKKTSVEVGFVVVLIFSLLGLAFNAGIQYARIDGVERRTTVLEVEQRTQHDDVLNGRAQITSKLSRIEALLEQQHKPAPVGHP